MSYRCDGCGSAVPNEHVPTPQPRRVVTHVRHRENGHGVEIAREKNLCPPCARQPAYAEPKISRS